MTASGNVCVGNVVRIGASIGCRKAGKSARQRKNTSARQLRLCTPRETRETKKLSEITRLGGGRRKGGRKGEGGKRGESENKTYAESSS